MRATVVVLLVGVASAGELRIVDVAPEPGVLVRPRPVTVIRMAYAGKRVEETTPEVVRFVEAWLGRTRERLVWDAETRRHAERDR